jgi:SAM-dependent methyltransferase
MERKTADYGFDAPGAVMRLGVGGLAALGVGQVVFFVLRGAAPAVARAAFLSGLWVGGGFLCAAAVMIWSSRVGKLRLRTRLLEMIPWRGDERVLDAGCGRGLALIGAAKRLTTGRATGIDVWSQEDLADNRPEATLENARAEGVEAKIELRTGDLRDLPFEDASFDAVVTMSAVHNIGDAAGRRRALEEMLRVLRPGGYLALFDLLHVGEYERVLRELGVREIRRSGWVFYWLMPGRRLCGRVE